jgi:predicted nucleic acid-binding protein
VEIVFLDANVLFSAAYRSDARVRRLWDLQDVVLVTSAYTVEEARRNLEDPQRRTELERLLQKVKVETVAPVNRSLLPAINLPDKDLPVLLAAIDAKATHLLTGDLHHFGPYYGQTVEDVLILPPAEYLRTRSGR